MASIQFDGTEILNTTYRPRFVKHESVADRSISTLARTRDDGDVLVAERYGKKVIRLQGVITASTQALLDTAIDTFTELFSRPEKNLDISWESGTRRYVATCIRHDFDRDHYHLNAVPWFAEFLVSSGEGKDTSETTLVNDVALSVDTTTGIATASYTFAGSKPPRPRIRISADADGAPVYFPSIVRGLEYKNTDTGERIIVIKNASWGAAARYIEIDCDDKVVRETVSGTSSTDVRETAFHGVFPAFKVGTNNVQITLGGIVNQSSLEGVGSLPGLGFIQHAALSATTERFAQSFMVPYTDSTFQGITLALSKTGAPGSMTVRIETDNGNKPSGTLAHADATFTIAAADVSTSFGYITKYATNRFSLSANTKYWIVISAASVDGSNFYNVGYDDNLYPTGVAKSSTNSGSTYSLFDTDATAFAFKIRYGGQPYGTAYSPLHRVVYTKTYL